MANRDGLSSEPKKRILIVDDDVSMVSALRRMFTLGKLYEIKVMDEGSDVKDEINAWHPQLVVIDVKMRGIDGFEVCSRIRSDPDNDVIRIVAISGTVEERDMKRMMELGANVYFEKPFDNKIFMEEIQRQLGIKADT